MDVSPGLIFGQPVLGRHATFWGEALRDDPNNGWLRRSLKTVPK